MSPTLAWDPEIESPATLLILGGGPIGIEAAIYARFLGYFVSIFEARRVGHRMLDWHNRPLALRVAEITSSLGHAAIAAQNPDYQRPDPDRIFTGREYAEEYLIPLAKTDLLFDDIHFLSPVVDVARIRTHRSDPIDPQDRCNDEFRAVVNGRHRGPWIARGDCVLDCRGNAIEPRGIGPGGGLAIGERELESMFYLHAPEDRKFVPSALAGKHLAVVGQSSAACRCVTEFIRHFLPDSGARLTWIVRPRGPQDTSDYVATRVPLERNTPGNLVILESLGVESISQLEGQGYRMRLLKEDDSSVDLDADLVMRQTGHRYRSIAPELEEYSDGPVTIAGSEGADVPEFVTAEPGYYCLRTPLGETAPGAGIPNALEQIRGVFAILGGRDDLDLYSILQRQSMNE